MRSLTKIMSIFGLVIEIKHLQKITLTWQLFFFFPLSVFYLMLHLMLHDPSHISTA